MKGLLAHFNCWILPAGWALVIFMLSAWTPSDKLGPDIPYLDKAAHLTIYGLFAFLIFMAFILETKIHLKPAIAGAIVIASLYGITDEWHQYYVPGRSVEFFDWVSDTVGATIGAFIGFLFLKHLTKTDIPTS